ncbi:hypothetical protein GCM10007385_46570 [Tateyamaria omphalii]|uniref:hypothetical protein n=1 Tax=Tateyamaria omphalii TaxID=299262 RepID=UPI001673ADB1|nr:hypothetical protein [Tateyamaria omphalii]GGX72472.1 hypothetical protein GCM10007385_46570 [Tateyamaria omphalii]
MTRVEFQVALFKGSETATGYLFEFRNMHFVAHKRGKGWRVSHFKSGRCVDHGASTRAEAIQGFKDAVEVGAFDLPAMEHKTEHSPQLNTLPEVA